MSFRHSLEQIPDTVKLGVSVSPPALTLAGIPVEQWTYVLSAIVSFLFIIEKLPRVIGVIKQFIQWIRNLKKD